MSPDSTPATDGAIRSPRGRRGALSVVTAAVVVAICAFGAVQAISLAMHHRTLWFSVHEVTRYGRATTVGSTVVLVVAIGSVVIGVLLLAAAAIPSRRPLVELIEPDGSIAAGITERSFRRALASAAIEVDGVSAARVSGRRRVTVRATTSLRHVETLPDRVRLRVDERLEQLNPVRTRTLRIVLDRKEH